MQSKTDRNRAIVEKRAEGGLTFAALGALFGISRVTAFEIYHRETMKNGSTKRISAYVVKRYPRLAVAS